MTLDEKAAMTARADMWTTEGIERLGIPSRRMTDGPNGARGRNWGVAGTPALAFPTGSALGATWDPELLREVGAELGRETRARAAHVSKVPVGRVRVRRLQAADLRPVPVTSTPIAWSRERLANYKVPAAVHVVSTLPTNPAGKVLKFERRSQLSLP